VFQDFQRPQLAGAPVEHPRLQLFQDLFNAAQDLHGGLARQRLAQGRFGGLGELLQLA
jgi:hypothetical protein